MFRALILSASGLVLYATGVLWADPPAPRSRVDVQVNPPGAQRPRVGVQAGPSGVGVEVNRSPAAHESMAKVSQTVGATVENPAGESVGKLEDLVIEDQSGRVGYAVLSFGGFAGIGDKYFAIPWRSLSVHSKDKNPDKKYFVADLNKDRLRDAPGFDKEHWPDFADTRTTGEIDKYYAATEPGLVHGYASKASQLRGAEIKDRAGEKTGKIEDIVLDVSQGKVRYLALGMGGFLGIGERLIAIPWGAVTLKHPADNLTKVYVVVDTDRQRLKEAPGFDKNEWPSFAEPFWRQDIDRYYAPGQKRATRSGATRQR